MIRENYAIKIYEEEKTKLQASRVKKFLAIKKLKKQIDEQEDSLKQIRSGISKTENKIKIWKQEKTWKRSCYALLKKHDYLWFDDTDYENISNIHKNSSWDTIVTECDLMSHSCTFWFGSDDFDDEDERDPYYDAHYCDSWQELHAALKEYVRIRRDKIIDAELDAEKAQ